MCVGTYHVEVTESAGSGDQLTRSKRRNISLLLGLVTTLSFVPDTDKEDEQDSELVVTELENIDDDCDARGISFVKIDNDDEAKEYGIDVLPTLVYFEKGVPSVYSGECCASLFIFGFCRSVQPAAKKV